MATKVYDVAQLQPQSNGRVTGGLDDQATLLSVDKALLVVELLLRHPDPLSARAIAELLGINRTTTHRLLNALIYRGWIEKPAGTASYRLSLKFLALAHVASQSRSFILEVRPVLDRLSRLSRETVHLGVLDGFEVVHIDKVESPERVGISSRVGSRAVPHVTGLGKALLAASPDAAVERYLRQATGRTAPERITNPDAFLEEIQETRERGYSIDNEEDSIGVRCLGVAVLGAGGSPLFAISLTGPSPRFTQQRVEELAPDVLTTARDLSHQFGWEPVGVDVPRATPVIVP
ncbi:MAG: IclR family transcriptional regulator [Thermomicrobiales bacterium]